MAYQTSQRIKDANVDRSAHVGFLNALKVEQTTRLIGPNFGASLDAKFWSTSASGTGAVTVSGNAATLATGATANSAITLTSRRKARFLFANPNIYRTSIKLGDTGTANNVRQCGAHDANNGPFFQLSGTTFSVVCRSGGSDANIVNSGSFNGAVSSWTVDTNVHAFEIIYFVMRAEFYIDGVLIHTFTPTTSQLFQELTNPITISNTNSGGSTTDVSMTCWNASILRFGKETTRPFYQNISTNATTVCKLGAGTLHRIIVNGKGGANNTATVYDNTAGSGTTIATLATDQSLQSMEYGVDFYTGLTVVTANGTAPNITVVYD